MLPFVRRSLLVQLLSVYLVFVIVVLLGGVEVNAVVEQQLRNDVQASDQALAQEIALQTSLQLQSAEDSLVKLGTTISFSLPLTALIEIGNDAAASTATQSGQLQGVHASRSSDQSASISPTVAAVPVDTEAKKLSKEERRGL